MSLLSYEAICQLLDEGILQGAKHDHINAASVDLVLGSTIMVERKPDPDEVAEIDMLSKEAKHLRTFEMGAEGILVPPQGVLLAHSAEIFNLPNWLSAEYKLKSTQARNFFNHLNAGWADAGWNGSVLTLEFVNHLNHWSTRIKPGMKCGQMVFFKHDEVPADKSYAARGQYNGDKSVTAGKGLR